jgi:hypothetical protein
MTSTYCPLCIPEDNTNSPSFAFFLIFTLHPTAEIHDAHELLLASSFHRQNQQFQLSSCIIYPLIQGHCISVGHQTWTHSIMMHMQQHTVSVTARTVNWSLFPWLCHGLFVCLVLQWMHDLLPYLYFYTTCFILVQQTMLWISIIPHPRSWQVLYFVQIGDNLGELPSLTSE